MGRIFFRACSRNIYPRIFGRLRFSHPLNGPPTSYKSCCQCPVQVIKTSDFAGASGILRWSPSTCCFLEIILEVKTFENRLEENKTFISSHWWNQYTQINVGFAESWFIGLSFMPPFVHVCFVYGKILGTFFHHNYLSLIFWFIFISYSPNCFS